MPNPLLLKARQNHSRIFAAALIFLILVSKPVVEDESFAQELMLWAGYFLVIFGAMGRIYCSAFIGGRKNDEIVREGPFSIVRNPLYVFSFIATVGIGLQSGMLLVTVVLIVAYVLYYKLVVQKEEAYLEHKFGEPYVKYTVEVPRWLPKLSLWREPDMLETKPRYLRKTMLDATIFFLPLPCFDIINVLQMRGILPVWLTVL